MVGAEVLGTVTDAKRRNKLTSSNLSGLVVILTPKPGKGERHLFGPPAGPFTALLVNEEFVLMTATTRLPPCRRTNERPEPENVDWAHFAACKSVIGKWRRPWIGY